MTLKHIGEKIKISKNNVKISVLENKIFDVKSYDVCIILTEWEEFKEIDFKGKVVFDGRNLLIDVPNKNYEYHSL